MNWKYIDFIVSILTFLYLLASFMQIIDKSNLLILGGFVLGLNILNLVYHVNNKILAKNK